MPLEADGIILHCSTLRCLTFLARQTFSYIWTFDFTILLFFFSSIFITKFTNLSNICLIALISYLVPVKDNMGQYLKNVL